MTWARETGPGLRNLIRSSFLSSFRNPQHHHHHHHHHHHPRIMVEKGFYDEQQTDKEFNPYGLPAGEEPHGDVFEHIDTGACGCNWGARGGNLCDCCTCTPCCGTPCNFMDGLYCCALFSFCFPCVYAKMYASSLDQPCGIVNHLLPYLLGLNCLMAPLLRTNVRNMNNVGSPGFAISDACLPWCCCTAPCASCQECRAVSKSDWDFLAPDNEIQLLVEPIRIIRPPAVSMVQ